jgi:ketosteroid isomerase-like protein
MMSSKLHQTALAYIGGFRTLSTEAFLSILAPSAEYKFAPASLNLPRSVDAATFVNHLGSLREVLAGFQVYPKEILENDGLGQVTIWATSETIFHENAKGDNVSADDWRFQGEYIFILTMDESQEKVVRIVEFLDSKATERLRELMARARKNLNTKKG